MQKAREFEYVGNAGPYLNVDLGKLIMKAITLLMFLFLVGAASGVTAQDKMKAVEAVAKVDLQRYSGKWFEIAKYPNKFQKQCVGNVTATYTLKPNNKLEVLNQCLKKDGTMESAKAEGKIADKKTNSKLKVRFAPGFTSFLPFVWANYWIIDLDPEYKWVVVAEPKRDYFWILSREPELNDTTYQAILRRAEGMGFTPGKVEKTPQGLDGSKGNVLTD